MDLERLKHCPLYYEVGSFKATEGSDRTKAVVVFTRYQRVLAAFGVRNSSDGAQGAEVAYRF